MLPAMNISLALLMLFASNSAGFLDQQAREASRSARRCKGVAINLSESLSRAMARRPEGTTFCVQKGVHRTHETLVPKKGQRLIGEPGAVISGARVVGNWSSTGDLWTATGQTQQSAPLSSEGSSISHCKPKTYQGCRYNEQLYYDNRSLLQVMSKSDVVSGTFFFDYAADTIYIADDPRGHMLEASVVGIALSGKNPRVTLRGLTIEKFGNPAQTGAVSSGDGWRIIRNRIRLNHGAGLHSDTNGFVYKNHVHHNGQLGIHGLGHDTVISRNEIAYNNTDMFNPGFEAGGTKWIATRGLLIKGNHSHHNVGPGLWTDIDNIDTRYVGNKVTHNSTAGIVHETSYRATIANNFVARNGHDHPVAATSLWGAGIQVDQSSDVEIFGNRLRGNANGITATHQPGGIGEFGVREVRNLHVHDNQIDQSEGGYAAGLYVTNVPDDRYYKSKNNRYTGNRYILGSGIEPFYWQRSARSIEEWVGFGQDVKGKFEQP
jgi:hypothetical protein